VNIKIQSRVRSAWETGSWLAVARPARTIRFEDAGDIASSSSGAEPRPWGAAFSEGVLRPHRTFKVKDAARRATRAHKHPRTRELGRKIASYVTAPERERRRCARPVRELDRRPRTPRFGLLCGALLTVFVLTPNVPSARASYDPLASGTAKLTLDPSFQHLLASHGVKLSALAPAKRHGAAYSLPVSEGSLDPTAGKGEIDTEGVLVFRRGRLGVPLRHLTVKTKREPLIAKAGGGQLKLAAAKKTSFAREGFGASFSATGLTITAKLATRLSKKLHLRGVFAPGQTFGTLRTSTQPLTTAVLPSGRASLTPDPAFIAKLDSLFVSLNPIAPAERQAGPLFTLPFIPAGTIAPNGSSGVPRSGGSLEFLQLGGGQIFWHELWFDLGQKNVLAEVDEEPTPAFPGKLGQLPILSLAAGAVSADPKARTVTITGTTLTLTAQTAAAFNEAFAKPQGKEAVFQAGEALGTLSFTAQAQ
jgi:hypothetical protein